MQVLMNYWQSGFMKHHPGIRFKMNLLGTGTAMAGLYTGVADIALMGRESTAKEVQAFEWVFKYKPLGVEVATGSLDVPGKSFAVTVFVHRDNPIERLTLTELDAIFGSEHLRGGGIIRSWGDLGLNGEWKNKPITTYGYDLETRTALFLKRSVLNGSDKWNCELREFADLRAPDGSSIDAGSSILKALAGDRLGIAFSNLAFRNTQVKPLALATIVSGPYHQATKENLIKRAYPLTRAAFIYVNRAPDQPLNPTVKEFLRYVLSDEGQKDVMREGDFLPLSEQVRREQLKQLEWLEVKER